LPETALSFIAKSLRLAFKIKPHSIRLTPDKLNELVTEAWTCSGQKLCQHVDFNYQDSLENILSPTLKDYKQRGWL
jgi:pyridoxine 5'-phosphate synthase PdxJ